MEYLVKEEEDNGVQLIRLATPFTGTIEWFCGQVSTSQSKDFSPTCCSSFSAKWVFDRTRQPEEPY